MTSQDPLQELHEFLQGYGSLSEAEAENLTQIADVTKHLLTLLKMTRLSFELSVESGLTALDALIESGDALHGELTTILAPLGTTDAAE